MKELFNINRYSKLVAKEFNESRPLMVKIIAIFGLILVSLWLITLITDSSSAASTRYEVIKNALYVTMFLIPFTLYGKTNSKTKGIDYVMLPASSTEKFLSMITLSTVVFPVILFLVSISTDTILAAITPETYKGSIISNEFINSSLLKTYYHMIILQSFGLFGNLLFIKHKIVKTLLSLTIINTSLSLIILFLVKQFVDIEHVGNNISIKIGETLVFNGMDSALLAGSPLINAIVTGAKITFYFIIPAIMFIGTYYKIRTQKY